jgi:hypothetical protein
VKRGIQQKTTESRLIVCHIEREVKGGSRIFTFIECEVASSLLKRALTLSEVICIEMKNAPAQTILRLACVLFTQE